MPQIAISTRIMSNTQFPAPSVWLLARYTPRMSTDFTPLALDHLGLFVPNGDAARQALADLGFTITPASAQTMTDPDTGQTLPAGTANFCVMFQQGYLEVLFATADDTEAGRTVAAEAAQRAGLHLLSFATSDARAFDTAKRHAGLPMRPISAFARAVEHDDSPITAAFTLARPAKGHFPEGRVQTMTHHTPEALWQPRWMHHANGAHSLDALLIAAPDPQTTAASLAAYTGSTAELRPAATDLNSNSPIWCVPLARGWIEVLPQGIARALMAPIPLPPMPHFCGLRIGAATSNRHPFPAALGLGVILFSARS